MIHFIFYIMKNLPFFQTNPAKVGKQAPETAESFKLAPFLRPLSAKTATMATFFHSP
jgi:hypothetical protein